MANPKMMIKMFKSTCFFIAFMCSVNLKASDSTRVDSLLMKPGLVSHIKEVVLSNFLTFQSVRVMNAQSEKLNKGRIAELDFGTHFLLDTNYRYALKIEILPEIKFPLDSYLIIRVYDLQNGYIQWYGEAINRNYGLDMSPIGWSLVYRPEAHMDEGLIAYNLANGHVLYICGPYFCDDIKRYFANDVESLKLYVQLKYYNYHPENVSINTKKTQATFMSVLYEKPFMVKLRSKYAPMVSNELIQYNSKRFKHSLE